MNRTTDPAPHNVEGTINANWPRRRLVQLAGLVALGVAWRRPYGPSSSAGCHPGSRRAPRRRQVRRAPVGSLDALGRPVGFDIDLARFFARVLFDDDRHVEFVPVTTATRFGPLENGTSRPPGRHDHGNGRASRSWPSCRTRTSCRRRWCSWRARADGRRARRSGRPARRGDPRLGAGAGHGRAPAASAPGRASRPSRRARKPSRPVRRMPSCTTTLCC